MKWTQRLTGCDIIENLKAKKDLVKWHNEQRKEYYLVVSKSGFTPRFLEMMDTGGVIGWSLQDILWIE